MKCHKTELGYKHRTMFIFYVLHIIHFIHRLNIKIIKKEGLGHKHRTKFIFYVLYIMSALVRSVLIEAYFYTSIYIYILWQQSYILYFQNIKYKFKNNQNSRTPVEKHENRKTILLLIPLGFLPLVYVIYGK